MECVAAVSLDCRFIAFFRKYSDDDEGLELPRLCEVAELLDGGGNIDSLDLQMIR